MFKSIEKAGQVVHSWVKESMMSEDVLVCVANNGGRASSRKLMKQVLPSRRKCTVPMHAHPITSGKIPKLKWAPKQIKWTSCRLDSGSESIEESNAESDSDSADVTSPPPKKKMKDVDDTSGEL